MAENNIRKVSETYSIKLDGFSEHEVVKVYVNVETGEVRVIDFVDRMRQYGEAVRFLRELADKMEVLLKSLG